MVYRFAKREKFKPELFIQLKQTNGNNGWGDGVQMRLYIKYLQAHIQDLSIM